MNLASLRGEFPVLDHLAYLNAGTSGPVARRSVEAAQAMLQAQLEQGRGDAAFFEPLIVSSVLLTRRIAHWMGCDPEELALKASTTDGVNTVLAGLSLGPGDEVLTSDEEHPGLLAPLAIARERCGFELRVAPFGELPDAVTARTKLVATSHVSWASGRILDCAAIDAPLLLDGAQGLGAVPVDVRALGCDYYAASGQKWLCGPLGTGYLYVKRERQEELRVTRAGYLSLSDPTRAAELPLQPHAGRFIDEVPSPHDVAWALAALDVLENFGADQLHERAAGLAEGFARALEERGRTVAPRGRSTLVSWEADDPEAESARLREQGFVIRWLPATPYVRASVGAWTSEDELERLAAAA
jgi:L-cysteine/cystine lyase